ncbi:MAG: hypothetical protein QUT27_01760 [candidate division Zixibacteria bacterium]|nr:hypothetical protein [candidate division Zixibacteria bacterium]
MTTIPQTDELLKQLMALLDAHRPLFKQNRVYERVVGLVLAEVLAFGRHTVTQLLMGLGLVERDWSAWYRLFSAGRFRADQAAAVVLKETLRHVEPDEVYGVGVDGTQTPRSSGKMEGVGWLRCPRTPAFKPGIHHAQRWLNSAWLMPSEQGYSRAVPLIWQPAFPEKAYRTVTEARSESAAAAEFLSWLRAELAAQGRARQKVLAVADGGFDTVDLWKDLPDGVTLMVRSAKNRVLHELPMPDSHGNRKYGPRVPTPQAVWQEPGSWRKCEFEVRGLTRHLQYRVRGPCLRRGAPGRPLFLVVVRGKDHTRHGKSVRRDPLPFLVNAVQNEQGAWVLPLPVETLLFWAWQRWELEVCHRELKTTFGLGHKQCFNPTAAVASVQWSAWVYALLLLAGYRTWGLCGSPPVPTRWWRGSGRWSLPTLWRAYRAALWGSHLFQPLWPGTSANWPEKATLPLALANAIYAAAFP